MASLAQTLANQRNAQHSTGPQSPEGKTRVAQNAVRHGLTAKHLVVRDADREDFAELHNSLLEELDPQGAIETITFRELLHAAWNLSRFRAIEVELSSEGPEHFATSANHDALDRLTRYQARAQRAYYRALQELRTLQTNRALRARKLPEEEAETVPVITDINELTKQTHSEVTAEALEHAANLIDIEAGVFLKNARKEIRDLEPHAA